MRKIDVAALALAMVGALNWGLVAIARFDLVAEVFGLALGDTNAVTRVVYGFVGLAGAWMLLRFAPLLGRSRQSMAVGG